MVYTLRFFSSKYSLFHNSNIFVSCIIHILYTGCAKIKKNNSGAKRLRYHTCNYSFLLTLHLPNRKDPHPATYKFNDPTDIPPNVA